MAAIDAYLKNVLRLGASGVSFSSGGRVNIRFNDGDRPAQQATSHRVLVGLIEEIAPLAAQRALSQLRPTEFPYVWENKNFVVRVLPKVEFWAVEVREHRGPRPMEIPPPVVEAPKAQSPLAPQSAPPLTPMATPVLTPVAVPRPPATDASPANIETMLVQMQKAGASDLHLSTGSPPMMRLHGKICPLPGHPPLSAEVLLAKLYEVTPERSRKEFEQRNDADFAHTIPGVSRFRGNLFRDRHGPGAVFRAIPFRVPTAAELGLPPRVLELCLLQKGLVLVTGPTGSGKSTTLASLINHINQTRSDHIITIEDPIEFVYEGKSCLIHQREVGVHTSSFKDALRAALREDPDIVLVGELRDLETIALAVETAETGHLVFGTLHTSSAPSTVDRIIDQFPADRQEQIRQMVSESLCGVIAQTLCSKIGGGRVAAYEILVGSSAVSNLIREGKTFQLPSLMQTGRGLGMVTLNDSLMELVRKKLIEPREAWLKCLNKTEMKGLLQREGLEVEEPAVRAVAK